LDIRGIPIFYYVKCKDVIIIGK
ncbi:unnamed protein product, partial [Allacma fusca]